MLQGCCTGNNCQLVHSVWIHKCSYVSNQFAFEHQVGEYHLVRTVCEDPSGTTSWAQLHILWACLCSSQVAHGLCEVPSMKVLTRGRMKEHWWGSFHDLSRLLAFYSLLRWPQTPCQPHMACACHIALQHCVIFPASSCHVWTCHGVMVCSFYVCNGVGMCVSMEPQKLAAAWTSACSG